MNRPHHGEPDRLELAALGLSPAAVLDLSTNVARGEPPSRVVEAIRRAALRPYPDRHAVAARRALAAHFACPEDAVLPGHGAAELLFSCLVAFALGRGRVLALGPTFGEPAHAARALGLRYDEVRLDPRDGFTARLAPLDEALTPDVAAVYVCDPNNPTGRCLEPGALGALARRWPATTFLLDESFRALSTRRTAPEDADLPDNVVRLRSLTKELSLAGVRVAVARGEPRRLARIDASRPSWVVSSAALAVLEVLPEVVDEVEARARAFVEERAALERALRGAGLHVVPSETVFSLVRVPDADRVRSRLLRDDALLVRSCTSFGLPEFLRVTACAEAVREHVVHAMVRAVAGIESERGDPG